MRIASIRTRILASFIVVIALLALSIALIGAYLINENIVGRAQKQVLSDLSIARKFYNEQIDRIKDIFSLMPAGQDLSSMRKKLGLDYLYIVSAEDTDKIESEIVLEVFRTGRPAGGTRMIGKRELERMGSVLNSRAGMDIRFTPMSKPSEKKHIEGAMAIGYAKPVLFDGRGRAVKVMYGGRLLNRDLALVDKIHSFVFEDKKYNGKPVGSVTIFQGDVRIATNVLDKTGSRALGTRVSQKVYDKVIGQGLPYVDKAFVVTDWYLTAYEPIKDIKGNVIGILYVGLLEEPFRDMKRNILMIFLAIIAAAALVGAGLSFILEEAVTNPINRVADATEKISGGELKFRVSTKTSIRELNKFARAFNIMAQKLEERDRKLKELNKSYLDLIGFVAHELKGILASTLLNAYSVRDGFLGMINFKQRKALDSIVKNLDYFESTIKNFLSLSRIEKGEMPLNRSSFCLSEDLAGGVLEEFSKPACEKGMTMENGIEKKLPVNADYNLMQIALNNIIGNAVKYGSPGGKIAISSKTDGVKLSIEVYNDGRPLSAVEKEMLFGKFSRLDSPETKKAKGTGLGLFITKEIIEKHGGRIWVEPGEKGNSFIFEIICQLR